MARYYLTCWCSSPPSSNVFIRSLNSGALSAGNAITAISMSACCSVSAVLVSSESYEWKEIGKGTSASGLRQVNSSQKPPKGSPFSQRGQCLLLNSLAGGSPKWWNLASGRLPQWITVPLSYECQHRTFLYEYYQPSLWCVLLCNVPMSDTQIDFKSKFLDSSAVGSSIIVFRPYSHHLSSSRLKS